MEHNEILHKIKEIAYSEENYITRYDLSCELDLKDQFSLSEKIYDAYKYFNDDEQIKEAFYTNDWQNLVVDDYIASGLRLTLDNAYEAINEMQVIEKGTNDIINEIQHLTHTNKASKGIRDNKSEIDHVFSFIKDFNTAGGIKKEINAIFKQYSEIVLFYKNAKYNINYTVKEYTKLRLLVVDIYKKYAQYLVDIFGDSIKATDPKLFNFKNLEFLDTSAMEDNAELEYNNLSNSCDQVMGYVDARLNASVEESFKHITKSKSIAEGLVGAGFSMAGGLIDSFMETASLQPELQGFKRTADRDIKTISADIARSAVINKLINENLLVETEIFLDKAEEVFNTDFDDIIHSVYNKNEVTEILNKKNELETNKTNFENSVNDAENNIAYYRDEIYDAENKLSKFKTRDKETIKRMPKKPFILFNLITFGVLERNYRLNYYDWQKKANIKIKKYEDTLNQLNYYNYALEEQYEIHENFSQQLNAVNTEIDEIRQDFISRVRSNNKVKEKLISKLESIIKLLQFGKQIASKGLNSELTKPITIKDYINSNLPAKSTQRISDFANKFRAGIAYYDSKETNKMNQEQINRNNYYQNRELSEQEMQDAANEDQIARRKENTHQQKMILAEKTVAMAETLMHLNESHKLNQIILKDYEKQYKNIMNGFKNSIKDIDDRNTIINEALKTINTSNNQEELKAGLFSLIEGNAKLFNKEDIDAFIQGKKTIRI